ncbi:MAG: nucleotidyltransferase domain-containing protein [Dehalococcoidia bacterium]
MPVRMGFTEYRRQLLEKELERLVEEMPRLGIPKVILVGSFARGQTGPDSDLNLVILHDTEYGFGRRQDFFSYHLDPQVAMHFVVYTPKEFEEESLANASLRYALERGRVVYESGPQS